MGFKVDFETGEGLEGVNQEKPDWLVLDKGQTVRVAFLSGPYADLVYDLRDKNADKEENYRGTFRSITATKGLMINDIRRLIAANDPDSQLLVDAKALGAPNINAVIPILVYPSDRNGKVSKDELKSGNFDFKIGKLTAAKFRRLNRAVSRLADEEKSITDVDFYITLEEGKRFPTWEFSVAGDSIYKKYEAKFASKVKTLINTEYTRLGVASIEDFGPYIAQDLTEDMWVDKLLECGYTVAGHENSDIGDGLLGDETGGVTSSPEFEDEINI